MSSLTGLYFNGFYVPKALVPHYVMNVGLPEADLDVQSGNNRIAPWTAPFYLILTAFVRARP